MCVMTLFVLQCPRIQGLLMLVLLLLPLLILLALPAVVVPLRSCSQLRHLEDALGYLCHMPAH
jgi:hypothetical protein